jgi:hypothetical protein
MAPSTYRPLSLPAKAGRIAKFPELHDLGGILSRKFSVLKGAAEGIAYPPLFDRKGGYACDASPPTGGYGQGDPRNYFFPKSVSSLASRT